MLLRAAAFALLLLIPAPPESDADAMFPALHVTLTKPQADDGPMTACARLDGKLLCDDRLGEAWCRKTGYAGGFDRWTTAAWRDDEACKRDDRPCRVVTTITCKGVPIMD